MSRVVGPLHEPNPRGQDGRLPAPVGKEIEVEEFLRDWGYLGIFLGIVSTGLGFPMPEELPVVIGGALTGSDHARWWLMLPVCIVGVIVGDSFLYGIGRLWGPRLLRYHWIKTHLLPPERLAKIEQNFRQYGVRILLFARLTPGIRAPIFFTAGLTRLSVTRFLLADGIYAVPGVSLLFFLGYWFTEGMVNLIKKDVETVKHVAIVVVIGAVAVYVLYRFLRRPAVTGSPREMPKVVRKVEQSLEKGLGKAAHKLEEVTTKIIHPRKTVRTEVKLPPDQQAPAAASDGAPPPADGAAPAHSEQPRVAPEPRAPEPRP
jgi:membrane protein DedA with SNARE-associated domain